MLLFDWDVIEEYGGRLERKIIVGDEVDNLLGKLPVFDSIRAQDVLVFSGLDLIDAKVAEGVVGVLSLDHAFLECPVGSLGDIEVEGFDLGFNI